MRSKPTGPSGWQQVESIRWTKTPDASAPATSAPAEVSNQPSFSSPPNQKRALAGAPHTTTPPRLLSYAGTTRSFFYLPHLSFRRVSLVEEKSRIRDPSTSHRPTLGMTSGLTPFRRIPLRPVPCELEECANRVGNLLASQHNRENARLI